MARVIEFDSSREQAQQARTKAIVQDVQANQDVQAILQVTGDKRVRPKAVKASRYKRKSN